MYTYSYFGVDLKQYPHRDFTFIYFYCKRDKFNEGSDFEATHKSTVLFI